MLLQQAAAAGATSANRRRGLHKRADGATSGANAAAHGAWRTGMVVSILGASGVPAAAVCGTLRRLTAKQMWYGLLEVRRAWGWRTARGRAAYLNGCWEWFRPSGQQIAAPQRQARATRAASSRDPDYRRLSCRRPAGPLRNGWHARLADGSRKVVGGCRRAGSAGSDWCTGDCGAQHLAISGMSGCPHR